MKFGNEKGVSGAESLTEVKCKLGKKGNKQRSLPLGQNKTGR